MGACFFGCLPPLPLACFLAPIPPTPFPAGRGRLRLSHARGFAPCIPGGWVGCGTGFACGKRVAAGGLLSLPPADSALQVPSGGLPSWLPAAPAFSLLCCPIPPTRARRALFPAGRGRPRLFHARGEAPCIPGAEPGRHRLSLPSRYPVQGEPEVRRKNDRTAFLLAVPAAKERGDRGRGTSAFEMVLSPGAGRTSAAGGLTFLVACLPCL